MAREFRITTKVGEKSFNFKVKKVSSVDSFLKKAKDLKKEYPHDKKTTIRIQEKKNGKFSRGILKKI